MIISYIHNVKLVARTVVIFGPNSHMLGEIQVFLGGCKAVVPMATIYK